MKTTYLDMHTTSPHAAKTNNYLVTCFAEPYNDVRHMLLNHNHMLSVRPGASFVAQGPLLMTGAGMGSSTARHYVITYFPDILQSVTAKVSLQSQITLSTIFLFSNRSRGLVHVLLNMTVRYPTSELEREEKKNACAFVCVCV